MKAKTLTKSEEFYKKPKVVYVLLFILSFILFGNTINHQYNFDDELVTNNHRLTSKGFSAIGEIFKSYYHEDNMGYKYEYRPVTTASFAVEHGLFGESPSVSHFINVLLYAFSVLLAYYIVLGISGNNVLLSIASALIFLSFPLHTEAVASIKNRDEILSLLFALLSTSFLLKFIQRKQFFHIVLIAVFFVASLLSKMSAFSFLLILPLLSVVFFSVSLSDYMKICSAVLIPATYVLFLRETSTSQIINYSLAAIVFFSVTFFLIQFIRSGKELFSIKNFFKKLSLPEEAIVFEKKDFSVKNILLYVVALFVAFYFSFSSNQHYFLIALLLYLLTVQYYFKNIPALELIAATLLLSLANYKQIFFEVNSLFLVFVFHKIYKSKFIIGKQFLLSLVIVFMFGLMYYLDDTLNSIILPSLLAVSLFLFNKYKPNKKYIGVFWTTVLCITITYPLFIAGKSISISNLIIPIFSLLYIIFDEKKLSAVISILIPVLFAAYLYNVPKKVFSNQLTPVKTQANSEGNISAQKQTNSKEDRPLDFVEFPLGFKPTFSQKYGTVAGVMAKYLKMMFVPYPMAFYYGYDEIKVIEITNPISIVSIVLHLLLLFVALYFARNHAILFFGIFVYLSSIILFSNLAAPIAGMFADRLTYVASFGFSIAIGYLFFLGYSHFSETGKKIFVASFIVLFISYSGLTIARNAQWKNALTLMRHDIQVVRNSAQAHNMLALNLVKYSMENEYKRESTLMQKEAIQHFRKATEIAPDFFNAWFDMGRVYMLINDLPNAKPCFEKVHSMDSTLSHATIALAMIAENEQDYSKAIYYYEKSIRITPYIQEAYANLSYLYFRLQQPKKSIEVNQRALACNPNWQEPRENIKRVEEFLKQNNLPLE